MEQDNTAGFSVAEQRDRRVHALLQVTETDDVAKGFDGIQYPVRAAEGLDETVHFQVFIHPKGVQCGCVKAGKEHIYHDQQIKFLVLHSQGDILVVVLELVAVSGVVGVEHLIVVPDCSVKEITAALVQGAGVLTVLLVQDAVCFLLVGSIAVNQAYSQRFCRIRGHLLFELLIIELSHIN